MAISNDLPDINEIEVSLFGPGVGEAICVHIGNGKWIIVDSCINPISNNPASLEYLHSIGVNTVNDVVLVIVSHWHDDHVNGISKIVSECTNAFVVFPDAMLGKDFLTLTSLQNLPEHIEKSGVSEISKVVSLIAERISLNKHDIKSYPIQARADLRLFQHDKVEIWALSPSTAAIFQSKIEIGKLLKTNELRRKLVPMSENLNAIAIFIVTEHGNVLLGADLETHSSLTQITGWQAVVDSKNKPTAKASIFKIPHHGSINGHHPEVWSDMLDADPLSIMTAYSRSKLPKSTDISRIKALSGHLYQTTINSPKLPVRDKVIESFLKNITKSRIVKTNRLGHIQTRMKHGKCTTKLNDSAITLK
ncbi:hypothetical protein [Shewanella sp. MF08487]|uniref:hypothetical protein n=1 Tax=Shewanella sp. MF08487 TaxID=3434873 RepID=UPI003D7A8D75